MRSRIRCSPSSPRSATTWVAPNRSAIFWRGSCRDIATTRSAPSWLRRQHAAQADRAVTDDDGGGAGAHPGRDRGVPAGGHHVGQRQQRRDHPLVGHPVGLDQRAVGLVDQGVLPLAAVGEPLVPARRGHPGPAVRAGVVAVARTARSTKSPGLKPRTSVPTSSMTPTHLVADRVARVDRVLAAVGPQVGAADAAGHHLDDGLGGLVDGRDGALLEADVAGCHGSWWHAWFASCPWAWCHRSWYGDRPGGLAGDLVWRGLESATASAPPCGENPTVLARLDAGFAVIGDVQFLPATACSSPTPRGSTGSPTCPASAGLVPPAPSGSPRRSRPSGAARPGVPPDQPGDPGQLRCVPARARLAGYEWEGRPPCGRCAAPDRALARRPARAAVLGPSTTTCAATWWRSSDTGATLATARFVYLISEIRCGHDGLPGRIGNLIRDARKHRGWTQQQLADVLSTSQSAVNRIERGHQNLTLEMLARSVRPSTPRSSPSARGRPTCGSPAPPRCPARSTSSRRRTPASRCCAPRCSTAAGPRCAGSPGSRRSTGCSRCSTASACRPPGSTTTTTSRSCRRPSSTSPDRRGGGRRTRSIIMFLGPLMHREDVFELPYAGGCDLGTRTVEPHMARCARSASRSRRPRACYHATVHRAVSPGRPIVLTERGDTVTENACSRPPARRRDRDPQRQPQLHGPGPLLLPGAARGAASTASAPPR